MNFVLYSHQIPHQQNPQQLLFLAVLEKMMVIVTAMTKVQKAPMHLPMLNSMANTHLEMVYLAYVKEIVKMINIARQD